MFLDLVQKRKSVRKFSPEPVSRDALNRCLEAARLAPSACNSQPWQFIVVDNLALKNLLADKAFSGRHAMNAHAKEAPVLVAVVRERAKYATAIGSFMRGVQFSLIDIGIAAEHFILQAAEEGLGTCWIGWFDERQVKKVLGLPYDKKVDILISVGYPANNETTDKVRKPLEEMAWFNKKGKA